MRRIIFNETEFILTDGGAITTVGAYEMGEVSYAHLMDNKEIKRYGKVIGHEKDIQYLGEIDIHMKLPDALLGLCGDSWDRVPSDDKGV